MAVTLSEFVIKLNKLIELGHGNKEVYMIDSASGCARALYGGRVSDYIGDAGPFDLENPEYISIAGDH